MTGQAPDMGDCMKNFLLAIAVAIGLTAPVGSMTSAAFGIAQTNRDVTGLLVRENSPPTNADLVDVLGYNENACSAVEKTVVSVCIAPSPNPAKAPGSTEALDVYDRSTIGCGICVRANAMGDGIYESMARDSGYGIDIVYTGGTSSVPVGPQLRLNNGYFGFASSGLAGAMQSILVADAGSSADDIHVEQQKTTGNTVELDQNWSTFAGTMMKLVVGAVGQSSTHPGAERGRCENCKFEAYYNNSSGSAVQEHSIDGEGNELNHGSVSVGNHLDQESTGDFANTCSMNGASSCAFALAHGYGAPACIATVQGTTPIAAACSVSGRTVTISAARPNSATWAAVVVGNPH
jgi:hypothetical protein